MQVCINQRTALEFKRNKLEDALLDNTVDRVVFKRKHDEIEAQLKLVDDRTRETEAQSRVDISLIEDVLNFTRDIGRTYDEAPDFLKRHFLRFFFEKIMVKNKKIDNVIYTSVVASLVENNSVIIKNLMLEKRSFNITKELAFLIKTFEDFKLIQQIRQDMEQVRPAMVISP
ncbi:MAG: hypothetical protein UZ20_WS6002000645 [candidate division WS6 bacterium OLB21]|uniref:Uncharacterized protein n=1 Tax=candidate division WS6 bacterium OLB21 TaxID=1617427 RepID=A0A136KIK9_9BACT|nr:MAG: hypothetical protein UZ20_WS6002000645 [candidate division WS6 bacterium OLB21]